MKVIKIFILPGLLLLAFACESAKQSPAGSNTNSNPNAASNAPVNTAVVVNAPSNVPVNSANQPPPQAATPAETFKALIDARSRKDTALLKALYSKKSLQMFAGEAAAQEKPLDEVVVSKGTPSMSGRSVPEIRNEKIAGDSATIEARSATMKNWEKIYFIKEDGFWRVAMDQYVEEMIRQVEESTKRLEKRESDEGDAARPDDK